jgi:hypothetical protein
MSARCVGEPVSWLRLERLRLGELVDPERTRVVEHLAACAACAACLARIEADEAVELPALALGSGARGGRDERRSAPGERTRGARWLPSWGARMASASALAAAAAAILVVGRAWRAPGRATVDGGDMGRPKGDGMAFVLVRDDGQRIVEAQGVFRSGDRFKALVTCPPGPRATFDLAVFDAAGSSFPLAPAPDFVCGNEVPLPGAFRLTPTKGTGTGSGSESGNETVCVVWGNGDELDREALSRNRAVVGPRAMCKELRPVGDGD